MSVDKKFYAALGMLAGLALLAWWALNDRTIFYFPVPVSMDRDGVSAIAVPFRLRGLVVGVLGMFAIRVTLHRQSQKMQGERENQASFRADVAQLVEHSLGKRCGSEALPQPKKEEVTGVTSTDVVMNEFQG